VAAQTEDAVIATNTSSLSITTLGEEVVVERDLPGFVWNRLQLAVMREALWLVENGVAPPEAVDTIVREGRARRWRHVGPFAAAALGGVDTWRRIGQNLLPVLSDAKELEGLERWLSFDEETLSDARRRRDAALASELVAEQAGTRSADDG
jgi:3-hydroxybutyryl-CoA dehydrogenase